MAEQQEDLRGRFHLAKPHVTASPRRSKPCPGHPAVTWRGNPLRAKLVSLAEDWASASLSHRLRKDDFAQAVFSQWPVPVPRQWRSHVNQPQAESEVAALRRSVNRGTPLGTPAWTQRIVKQMGLEVTTRPRGRPKQVREDGNGA